MMHEFVSYPKIGRLNRDIIITEKLDGTNSAIRIADTGEFACAQSRNRIITPDNDNYGFARWCRDNQQALAALLGPGLHFGEWWGLGVQRGYGLKTKVLSLFNVTRWAETFAEKPIMIGGAAVNVVPKLYEGPWITRRSYAPELVLEGLREHGSNAAPGFMKPEGIVVFHAASGALLKATLERDEQRKAEA
jgi:hypothetical protein